MFEAETGEDFGVGFVYFLLQDVRETTGRDSHMLCDLFPANGTVEVGFDVAVDFADQCGFVMGSDAVPLGIEKAAQL